MVGNMLRTILHTNSPPNEAAHTMVDYVLLTAAYFMKAATHCTRSFTGDTGFSSGYIYALTFVADLLVCATNDNSCLITTYKERITVAKL